MPKYVIDTNLYVEAITTDEGNEALAAFQRRFAPLLFQHSTVAQEILAGARDESGYRAYHEGWISPFEDLGRVVTPTHSTWLRAALIMARLVEGGHRSPGGFTRSFLNDCLIAASAREQGFVLVTRNTGDFALIGRVEPSLTHVPPWPER
ncbi:MAG: PIN domain-containing protein [Gemmatimonas sp.]|nr:PIN domain-containing protein [Gemmatimonas sp.]